MNIQHIEKCDKMCEKRTKYFHSIRALKSKGVKDAETTFVLVFFT